MKTFLSSLLAGTGLLLATTATASVAVIELERSGDMNSWEKVPVSQTLLTPTGGILQTTNDPHAFYRLRIRDDEHAGFTSAWLLSDAPPLAVDIAQQLLRDELLDDGQSEGDDPESSWRDVILGPVCHPIYDPSVDDGKTPAYVEFKVIKKPLPIPDPPPDSALPLSPPVETDDQCDFGRILVALTQADFPVVEFAHSGPTHVETLLRQSRTDGPIKPVRFDEGLLVAEDENGAMVGSLGNEPFQIDPEILSVAGQEFEGLADESGEKPDGGPEFPARGYQSYADLKREYAENPLYMELRRLRAELAAPEWVWCGATNPPRSKCPCRPEPRSWRSNR